MVRFYTGRPNPNVSERDRLMARNLDRRLAGIQKSGVTVITRTLDYHWEWSLTHNDLPRPKSDSPERTVTARPWQRPQEKGIDLVLGLEAIEFVAIDVCDVLIIVSADKDLFEVPKALAKLASHIGRPFRVEAAVPCAGQPNPRRYSDFDGVHFIDKAVFDLVRDDTYYAAKPEKWVPPDPPRSLADHLERLQADAEAEIMPATAEDVQALRARFGRE
jgi:hypothetical protein